ncbi:MAG: amidohydrolase [Chloroflexota bacterium]
MPASDALKARINAAIDGRGEYVVGIAKQILRTPEYGYRETYAAGLVADAFREAGIAYRDGIAITGVKAVLDTGRPGPTVGVIGELDSIGARGHEFANPETGAAHACGHHCQIGSMLGAGLGLLDSGALDQMSGRVVLIAVPAEEYVEIEYRLSLRREGKIEFLVGKNEMIRLGELDDVDMAMMTHASSQPEDRQLAVGMTSNGMVAKFIRYTGKASHAGGAPHLGINALGAAHVALAAIHAQRETFRDDDHVRVHPIITKGGDLVSVIPADVRMETFVRASTPEAIEAACVKVDRALRAGAMAMGARLDVTTIPGYLPLRHDARMSALYRANATTLVGAENVGTPSHRTGGTDMGDLSQIMPVIHPVAGGATGPSHSDDFNIVDYDLAVVKAAKGMALTVADLLANDASEARAVLQEHKPPMTKAQYLAFVRRLAADETYQGDK